MDTVNWVQILHFHMAHFHIEKVWIQLFSFQQKVAEAKYGIILKHFF